MANNYEQFSELITITDESKDWLIYVLALDGEGDKEELLKELGIPSDSEIDLSSWPGCEHKVKDNTLWVYGQEGVDTNCVAHLVQALIVHFMPDFEFTMTTACLCSKLRAGEFGGGWMVVTKDTIVGGNTWDSADEWLERHKKLLKGNL